MLEPSAWYGSQVFANHGKAEICEARMTGVIHQDIYLVWCEYDRAMRFRTTVYPLEIPMYNIA